MNESLKIGAGILLGFILLGGLFLLLTGLNNKTDVVLKTSNLRLEYSQSDDVYAALIKNSPENAKQEVYDWMLNKEQLTVEEICEKIIIFKFSEDVPETDKNSFEPRFRECSL